MPNRATRRAAERQAAILARKANPAEIHASVGPQVPAASLLPTAFDFADEEDDALSLSTNRISKALDRTEEKALAASASASGASGGPNPIRAPISDNRLAANRSNAQLSTGPKTVQGKAKASLNAVKTGLTGQTVVLPTDDAASYQQHIDRHFAKYSPATDDEHTLVQSIADTEWRILRIAPLEAAIYSLGHREFADEFRDEENPVTRAALVRGKTMLHYRRDLGNLALQERRLRNHREKDVAQLEALQKSRADKRKIEIAFSIKFTDQARQQGSTFAPSDCGFDFSNEEFHSYLDQTGTQFRLIHTRPDFDKFLAAFRAGQKGAKAA